MATKGTRDTNNNGPVKAYAEWIVRWRWPVMLASLLTVIAAGWGAQHLRFTSDYRAFFGPENPQLQAFEALQDVYTKNDNILFVVTPDGGRVFDTETLSAVADLTESAWQLPYSIRVDSVTNFQHTYAEGDDLVVEDLVADPGSLGPDELAAKREVALDEPLIRDRLLNSEASVTAVTVTFQLQAGKLDEVPEAVGAARELAQRIESEYPEVTLRLTGTLMLNAAFSESSQSDMKNLVPLMYAAIILAMLLILRSLAGTVGSVIVIAFSAVTAMGLAGWLGITLTPPSAEAPLIIMTLAVADCVHILVSMAAAMRGGMERRAALVESLRINMQPIFLTSITTAVGFLTMNFADAPPFQDLGNITAMGIVAAWVWSVTFLPALIAVLPVRARAGTSMLSRGMDRFAEFVIVQRRPVLWIGTAVAVGILAMIPQNELNDDFIAYFDDSIEFRRHTEYTLDHLTGIHQIQYSLPAGGSGDVSDPDYLRKLEDFTQWLRSQPETVHVNSFTDVMKRLNQNMHGDDPDFYRIPQERDLAAQYLLLYELSLPYGLDLTNQVNLDKSATQLVLTLENVTAVELREMAARSRTWLETNTPSMATEGVSTAVMFAHISQRNIETMLGGTLIGLAVISLILVVALKSVTLGLISAVPNLLPAGLAFGVWGLLVGEVNMAVSVVVAMSLGIVVDDTVHFLSKYLRARREKGLDAEAAVRYAFSSVGVALVVTTIVLVAGFAVLAQSSFGVNSAMAKLTAIAITLALIADFFLLPPVLIALDRKDRGEQETTDLQNPSQETDDALPTHHG